VLSRTGTEDLLAGLHLSSNIETLNFTQDPLFAISNQEVVSRIRLFLNNGDSSKVALHNDDSWSIWDSYDLAIEFRFPVKLFPVLSKYVFDELPPKVSMFSVTDGHLVPDSISFILHLFKAL
jgi:hypothetical protein